MKYDFKNGQFIIEIDLKTKLLKIQDLFGALFEKEKKFFIDENLKDETVIKEKINTILDKNFDANKIIKMLSLAIEENESIETVFELGTLDISDYSLYYSKIIIEELGINENSYCFIGGQILHYYNVFRQTADTDILILVSKDKFNSIINKLKKKNIDIEFLNIDNNELEPIGNLIRFYYEGVEIDLMTVKFDFQKKAIGNAQEKTLSNNKKIKIISLVDLIIFKLYGGGFKDISDIDALIRNNKLNKDEIEYIKETMFHLGYEKLFFNFFPNE